MSEQTTRAGIPLDTLPEQPTVRQAAQALMDITADVNSCDCRWCRQARVLRDALANEHDERETITEVDLRDWIGDAAATWFNLGEEDNRDGKQITAAYDLADHVIERMRDMGQVATLLSGLSREDRTAIQLAANYIENDRRARETSLSETIPEEVNRINAEAQFARMTFGDSHLERLKQIGER